MSVKGVTKAIARSPHLLRTRSGTELRDIDFDILDITFENAEKSVNDLDNYAKSFQETWSSILNAQDAMSACLVALYNPLPTETRDVELKDTPRDLYNRVDAFSILTSEMYTELSQSNENLCSSVLEPFKEVKRILQTVKKAIKKRAHKKLDRDRFSASTKKLRDKLNLSEKETKSLEKLEQDLYYAEELFQVHDQNLKTGLPILFNYLIGFIDPIQKCLYSIQLSLYETAANKFQTFVEKMGMDYTSDIIDSFSQKFSEVRIYMERDIETIRSGKAASFPFGSGGSSGTRLSGHFRTSPFSKQPSLERKLTVQSSPPTMGSGSASPSLKSSYAEPLRSPRTKTLPPPIPKTKPTLPTMKPKVTLPLQPASLYIPENGSKTKRPPPPTPPKKSKSGTVVCAIAKYSFDAETQGDLSFREGDRIRIIEMSDNTESWWKGELKGKIGSFPANFVELL
ncbi:Regulator of cytoskeleton and endocytosis RVS167 [Neolecta irregularis DAH-3]|uniref:Regulator of cytoskeleton and endocytosis RVS167 n=1 Tax=Neolecta irregularis (strain DAH-3) TaxID=1198029 RepID=A0A1U7LGI7_NEOID|nr:Regulator of cytoskeleton and endocytosis RVS167 [Neolecta irregularis DAH-3]|eukprot:OLL21738.1 Regulator of cytoskeleton and endocytosis RVS167 [Neolecta irregularis DAH-3]